MVISIATLLNARYKDYSRIITLEQPHVEGTNSTAYCIVYLVAASDQIVKHNFTPIYLPTVPNVPAK